MLALALDAALLIVPTVAVAVAGGALALRLNDPEGLRALWAFSTDRDVDPAAQEANLREVARHGRNTKCRAPRPRRWWP